MRNIAGNEGRTAIFRQKSRKAIKSSGYSRLRVVLKLSSEGNKTVPLRMKVDSSVRGRKYLLPKPRAAATLHPSNVLKIKTMFAMVKVMILSGRRAWSKSRGIFRRFVCQLASRMSWK